MEYLRVIKVSCGKEPQVIEIEYSNEVIQAHVGYYMLYTSWSQSNAGILCNDDHPYKPLPPNRPVTDITRPEGRVMIYGDFLIVGTAAGNFTSLSDAQVQKYTKEFSFQGVNLNE